MIKKLVFYLLSCLILISVSLVVLPVKTLAVKRIEVNLTNQTLYAYDDNTLISSFLVSTGKWNLTPTGTFYPWVKLLSTRMKGGNKSLGTYYDLPNVPYVIYFGNAQIPGYYGYSIHGTYWHNNFGHPMSHGCINMRIADAAWIYNWINMSTPINIYGVTPL